MALTIRLENKHLLLLALLVGFIVGIGTASAFGGSSPAVLGHSAGELIVDTTSVVDNSLTGSDILESSLGTVPSATSAGTASICSDGTGCNFGASGQLVTTSSGNVGGVDFDQWNFGTGSPSAASGARVQMGAGSGGSGRGELHLGCVGTSPAAIFFGGTGGGTFSTTTNPHLGVESCSDPLTIDATGTGIQVQGFTLGGGSAAGSVLCIKNSATQGLGVCTTAVDASGDCTCMGIAP